MYASWDMVRDGQTDRRMEKVTQVGAPPKKSVYFNKYKPFWTLKVVWSTKFYMGILIHLISTLYFTIYLLLQQHTTYYKYFHDDFFHKIKFCSILPEITFTISS